MLRLAGCLLLAACAAAPERTERVPMSEGTGFITDGCFATGRPPEPGARAAYLDAAEAWLVQPDVRMGPFRPEQFATLTTADCGAAWLVWNTTAEGGAHPRGTLYVMVAKGLYEFIRLQSR